MKQWLIDAFARAPFKGNPAGVVAPFAAGEGWPDPGWMQALAQENNQAETAFLLATDDPARFGLRWFTPTVEVPLCGHATLASAHLLFSERGLDAAAVTFDTRSGPLIVTRDGEGYAMDFPADPPHRTPCPEGLAEAVGVAPIEVWAGQYLIALFADEATVRGLTPDLAKVARIGGEATRGCGNLGCAAVADSGADYDVVDRFFAPGSGIAEDPTTGSLHCSLGPMFTERLSKPIVRFHQAYSGRGGDLTAEVRGDRVLLSGQAVTVAESSLRIAPI